MSVVSRCLPRKSLRGITELKGKSVGVKPAQPDLLTLMAAQVGLNAAKDIHWVTDRKVKPLELFAEGKIDAFLGFAPEPQELRARHAGHVIATTTLDRPWSQYFCCMLTGNREFVRNHAVATKRVVRAVLKATDLCATEPTQGTKGRPFLAINGYHPLEGRSLRINPSSTLCSRLIVGRDDMLAGQHPGGNVKE